MKPVEFEEHNRVFAKDQPEYMPLPAFMPGDREGSLVSCWQMSWRERITALLTGKVWLTVLTFRQPLQPLRMEVEKPQMEKEE